MKKSENCFTRLYSEFQTVFDLSLQIFINQKAVNLNKNLHIKLHITLQNKLHITLHIKLYIILHNQLQNKWYKKLQIKLHITLQNKLHKKNCMYKYKLLTLHFDFVHTPGLLSGLAQIWQDQYT